MTWITRLIDRAFHPTAARISRIFGLDQDALDDAYQRGYADGVQDTITKTGQSLADWQALARADLQQRNADAINRILGPDEGRGGSTQTKPDPEPHPPSTDDPHPYDQGGPLPPSHWHTPTPGPVLPPPPHPRPHLVMTPTPDGHTPSARDEDITLDGTVWQWLRPTDSRDEEAHLVTFRTTTNTRVTYCQGVTNIRGWTPDFYARRCSDCIEQLDNAQATTREAQ